MRDLIILFVHVIATVVLIVQPGGVRAVIAESALAKRQRMDIFGPSVNAEL